MKSILKGIVALIIRYSGLGFIMREIVSRDKVTIILYHTPPPDKCRKHLQYMSGRYRFIRMDELVDALHGGDWSGIPPKRLL